MAGVGKQEDTGPLEGSGKSGSSILASEDSEVAHRRGGVVSYQKS